MATVHTTYYCQYCQRRHHLMSRVGWHHYGNRLFASRHRNNCILFQHSPPDNIIRYVMSESLTTELLNID